MGKQSTRENKTFYQICREEAGLTRSEASEKMTAVSDSKIEKFEYEMQEPTPYDIIQMADAYRLPVTVRSAMMRSRILLLSATNWMKFLWQ